jgi:hypothetical protein
MNTIYVPTAGDTGEEERRKHIEVEPATTPATVPAEPVPA